MIELEIYQCSHCAGAVKPGAERCSYCGYWFKKPAPHEAWAPVIMDTIPPPKQYLPTGFADVVKSTIYIEYMGHVVEINGNVEYAMSNPIRYVHSISGQAFGVHEGPANIAVKLSTLATSESVNILRALYQSNEYFDVLSTRKSDGVPEKVFEKCKIETIMTRYDTRNGIPFIMVDLLLRPLHANVEMI